MLIAVSQTAELRQGKADRSGLYAVGDVSYSDQSLFADCPALWEALLIQRSLCFLKDQGHMADAQSCVLGGEELNYVEGQYTES